jgi:MoaA/NifB/PqqE/SkfB family radical SAM enzyme
MFKSDQKYKIHWELTDICNLKCPMCPRTDISQYCQPVKEVEKTQFFLGDVEKFFPDKFLKKIKRIDFCGNYGDPCMAQDCYEICELLVKKYQITIMASTNGSMRNPSWWKKLGELLAGTDSWFEFHIDGLRDTNHLYRIGANWDKVMANVKAFIDAGARADWHYILFNHNQHQVDEAHALANDMGFNHFVPTLSGRFPHEGKYSYMHPSGDWVDLEQATISLHHGLENPNISQAPSSHSSVVEKETKSNRKVPSVASAEQLSSPQIIESMPGINGINCKSASKNRFYLDSRGYISPCCWVTNRDVQRPGDMLKTIAKIGKNIDDYNIRNRPIEEILADELFTEVFPALWQSDELATCRKKCGDKRRNYKVRLDSSKIGNTDK